LQAFGVALVCFVLILAIAPPLHGSSDEVAIEEVRREVLELDGRIRELLATLPEDAREELLAELARSTRSVAHTEAPDALEPAPPGAAPTAEAPVEPYFEPVGSIVRPVRGAAGGPSPERGDNAAVATSVGSVSAPGDSPLPTPVLEAVTPECLPLGLLDTNGDGRVSAGDRYWRHLYLASTNTGALDAGAVESLYSAGVRELDLGRGVYTNERREVEDLHRTDRVELRNLGRQRTETAWLVLDASGLAEGGNLRLLSGEETSLTGFQRLSDEMLLEGPEGPVLAFCDGKN